MCKCHFGIGEYVMSIFSRFFDVLFFHPSPVGPLPPLLDVYLLQQT